MRAVIVVVGLALTIYGVIDCLQTPVDRVKHLPKWLWLVLVVLVPWLGALAWLVAGRSRSLPPGRNGGRRPITGPRGPEDDPDFLRNL